MTIVATELQVYEEESRGEESVCRCEDISTGQQLQSALMLTLGLQL